MIVDFIYKIEYMENLINNMNNLSLCNNYKNRISETFHSKTFTRNKLFCSFNEKHNENIYYCRPNEFRSYQLDNIQQCIKNTLQHYLFVRVRGCN